MRKVIGVVIGLVGMACCDLSAQAPVWWTAWSFRAAGVAVEGVPVKALNPVWRSASVIRRSDLPPAADRPGERPEDYGLKFTLDLDLDKDGQAERVVVGVFSTADGQTGRFLLILGKVKGAQSWTKRGLFTVDGSEAFSSLGLHGGTLQWYLCLECDVVADVVRRGSGFELRWLTP